MKLYLSSYRIPTPEDLFELIGKKPNEIKVAIIPNAKDYYAVRARKVKLKSTTDSFEKIGITDYKIVDLREYKDQKLRQELETKDLIWCVGGNTFCLMEQVVKSGFKLILEDLLEKGVVYAGESAGAIIVGRTLRGVEFADEPEFAETINYQGMGLIDNIIVPHVGNSMYSFGVNELLEMHQDSTDLIKISDDEAYVVDGSKTKIVSAESK